MAILDSELNKVRDALRSGDLSKAEQLLDDIVIEHGTSENVCALDIEMLMRARRMDEAHSAIAHSLDRFKGSSRILYLSGRHAFATGNFVQAADYFSQSDAVKSRWLTQRWQSQALIKAKKYKQAEEILLAILPNHPQVRLDLATLYELTEQYQVALMYVNQHLNDHPDDILAQTMQEKLREQEKETVPKNEATKGSYNFPKRVESLLEEGKNKEVEFLIKQNLPLWNKDTAAEIAWCCYRRKLYDLSLELFKVSLEDHLHDYEFLSAFESSAMKTHRVEEALSAYESLVDCLKPLEGRIKALRYRVEHSG